MRVALLVLAGCWTGSPAPAPERARAVRYSFSVDNHDFRDKTWRVSIEGDHFTFVREHEHHAGTVAWGPDAMDLRDGNTVLLACRRHQVEVHPYRTEMTLACDADLVPIWSQPAKTVEAWICADQSQVMSSEIILVEGRAIEGLVRACCEADVCDRSYTGYRFAD